MTTRGPGRPKTCLPYHEARAIVRAEVLKSRIEYRRWWLHNKPSMLPKNPNRAYVAEWIGWGDWLGNSNPFPCVRKKFRSYKDARAWAQTLGFRSKAEWTAYAKSAPNFPADVPKRPDFYYQKSKEWLTWKNFLGYTAMERKASVDEVDHIIYVIQYKELPTNVFTIGITNEGKDGLMARRREFGFNIIAGFYHDKETDWMSKIEEYLSPYQTGSKNYIVRNINDVLYALSTTFNQVR